LGAVRRATRIVQRGARRAGAVVAVLVAAAASPAEGAFEAHDRGWEGTSEFVALAEERLGAGRVQVTRVLDWRKLEPQDGLLVLHPLGDLDFVEASSFLRAGGRLAVLDDHGRAPALLEHFRIRRVPAPRSPRRALRADPDLGLAFPSTQVVAGHEQGRHPIVAAVEELVTNHPTGLEHPDLTPVLVIPAVDEPEVTLAVTGIIAERGRLFAMGDPSVLINLMLRYPGNRAFAAGLIDYLVEDDAWGARGGRLFVLANEFEQRRTRSGATALLRDLDEDLGKLRERLGRAHEEGLPGGLAVLLAILAAVGAIGWVMGAATRPYRQTPPRFARGPALAAQGGAAGRVAILAAPTTHRVLVLLELANALQERLGLLLGLSPPHGWGEILSEIDRQRALGQRSSEALRSLVEQIRALEAAVAASRPTRATANRVHRMRATVESILREVAERRGGAA